MATQAWITKLLRQRGVQFEESHHREAYTAQEVAHGEHFSGHRVAKVVVAMADDKPVELVLPASRRVVLDRVRDALGAEDVRLATETEIAETFTDCEVGAIPALQHWEGIPILMDESLGVEEGQILLQGGTHSDAVRVQFEDWFKMVSPRVAAFSVPEKAVSMQ